MRTDAEGTGRSGDAWATIDLGTYRRSEPAPPGPSPSPSPGGRYGLLRRRRSGAAALVVAVVAVLGGGAAPGSPELVPVWRVPGTAALAAHGGSYTTGAERLYVAAEDDRHFTVTAYRLSDGQVEWRSPGVLRWPDLPRARTASAELYLVDGVLLLYEFDHVTGYDPATGRLVWSREGMPVLRTEQEVLLHRRGSGRSERPAEVLAVDLRTGRAVGARLARPAPGVPVNSGTIEYVAGLGRGPAGTRYLYTMRFSDGELHRYELGAGAGPLPTRVDVSSRIDTMPVMRMRDGTVLVGNLWSGSPYVGALHPGTLQPYWTAGGSGVVVPCGPVVCQVDYAAPPRSPLRGLDPATGTVRWELGCAEVAVAEGCRMDPSPLPSGDILVRALTLDGDRGDGDPADGDSGRGSDGGAGSRLRPTSWIIDGRSGQQVGARVDGWFATPSDVFGAVLVGAEEQAGTEPEAEVRTWYAVAGPDLAEVEVVGSLDGALPCAPVGRHLVCGPDGEDLAVWRIDP